MRRLRLPDRHHFAQAARGVRARLPESRNHRTVIGLAFVSGGLLSFLPFLGAWMLPVGLVVLSVDWPKIRRMRRRIEVRVFRTPRHAA